MRCSGATFTTALVVSVSIMAVPGSSLLSPLKNLGSIPRGGVRTGVRQAQRRSVGSNDTAPFLVSELVIEEEVAESKTKAMTEVLAGVTVALASIPSSIAFASIAGVDPLVGVWSSVILSGVSSVAGMRPGLIAGAAGVVAVPLGEMIKKHGTGLMAPTIVTASFMELIFSVLRGGRLVQFVSDSVMDGFLNALGFLLLRSQIAVFQSGGAWLPVGQLAATSGVAATTAALSFVLPILLPGEGWPTAIMAIVFSTLVSEVFHLPVARLAVGGADSASKAWYTLIPTFKGLPSLPSLSAFGSIVAPVAFSIAIISILETLLAVKVMDEADEEGKLAGSSDLSCCAMAAGNLASALFGGFGGCGLIPHSLLNLQSGGTGVTSVLTYCAVMTTSVLFLLPLINKVPVASLAGIMTVVGLKTIRWRQTAHTISALGKPERNSWNDSRINVVALALTTALCVRVDMGTGIILGVLTEKLLSWGKSFFFGGRERRVAPSTV